MRSFHENMTEYRRQLEQGNIQLAYIGLMEYILGLRTYFKNKYPDHHISGSTHYGYMDMNYFSFIPGSFIQRDLKVAIVLFMKLLISRSGWRVLINRCNRNIGICSRRAVGMNILLFQPPQVWMPSLHRSWFQNRISVTCLG